MSWINKVKQYLGLRLKSDIENDLEDAKQEEIDAQQEYEDAKLDYDTAQSRLEKNKEAIEIQKRKVKSTCNQDTPWTSVACPIEQAKLKDLYAENQRLSAAERDSYNKYKDAEQRYNQAIAHRQQLEKELDEYKYPI